MTEETSERSLLDFKTADGRFTLSTFSILQRESRTRRRVSKFQWLETGTEIEASIVFDTEHEALSFRDGYDEAVAVQNE